MSFVYDTKLLSELLKHGLDAELKLNKKAQMNAGKANVDYQNYLTLTGKLADQIRQIYAPTAGSASIVTSDKDATLGIPELTTFGNFLNYTVANGVKVGGQRVAYSANDEASIPDKSKWLPVDAEESHSLIEEANAHHDYYVNKDLMVTYINSMLQKTSNMDEDTKRLFKTMLGTIVQKVNQNFRTKLTTDYTAPVQTLPDETVVDGSISNPLSANGRGNIQLTIADLKSPEDLNAWLEKNQISIKDVQAAAFGEQGFNPCDAIKVLYDRAASMKNQATPKNKAAVAEYLRLITQIASQSKCNVGQGQQGQRGDSNVTPGDDATLENFSKEDIFYASHIDLDKITEFVDDYAKWRNSPDMNSLRDAVLKNINNAKTNLLTAPGIISIGGMSRDQFKMLAKPNKPGWPTDLSVTLANVLYDIIDYSSRMYQDLATMLERKGGASLARPVLQALAGGGPVQSNLNFLSGMMKG